MYFANVASLIDVNKAIPFIFLVTGEFLVRSDSILFQFMSRDSQVPMAMGGGILKGDKDRRMSGFSTTSDDDDDQGGSVSFKAGRNSLLRSRAAAYNLQHSPKVQGASASRTISDETKLTLVVDGTRFVVSPALFTKHPDTMLGRMFSSDFDFHPNSR